MGIIPQESFTLFFETETLIGLGYTERARLASQPANHRNPAVSSYPVLGSQVQVHARTPLCSHRCLEIKLEGSCLHSKHFLCNCLPAFSLVLS